MKLKPREIWAKGTPLNDAWRVFSDSKLRAQLDATDPNKNSPFDHDKGFWEFAEAVVGHLNAAISAPRISQELTEKLRANLKADLASGKLLAFGFPTWPSVARIPRRIQDHFWVNAEINWEREIANDSSFSFQKIRVINPSEFPDLNLTPKIGRNTHRELIYKIIAQCVAENPKFQNQRYKIKIPKIREGISKLNPNIDPSGPGLSDDAIRKHLTTYFAIPN